jgi:hypothetical protein
MDNQDLNGFTNYKRKYSVLYGCMMYLYYISLGYFTNYVGHKLTLNLSKKLLNI